MRFEMKINLNEYYLSYSGGRDSHFLLWFIKDYMRWNIPVIAVNTCMEHHEILKRINDNSDEILKPKLKMFEIKEKYGIPCFSKNQDEYIKRYQRGSRSAHLMERISPTEKSLFSLSKKASTLLLNSKLHKISPECCTWTKKQPLKAFEKKTQLKAIVATRNSEGILRGKQKTCLDLTGKFKPIYDFSDEVIEAIENKYGVEVPKIYDTLSRTGCFGCPYGKNSFEEVLMLNKPQQKFVNELFKESYDVLDNKVEDLLGDK